MYSEPNMSDTTLLVSVEDLINRAMGPPDVNVVNFKLIQMVLQILARQQRMLKQRVEIKVAELADLYKPHINEESTESSSSKSPRRTEKRRMAEIKEEREKDEKDDKREKFKEQERAQKIAQKEQEKARKAAKKEQEKAEKDTQKEQEKAEETAKKEHEKAEKAALKAQEKAQKRQEKAEKAEKAALKEKEKAHKGQERAEKVEKAEKAETAEKAEKVEKEEKAMLKEKEKAQKEQEKLAKTASKEQDRAEKAALKEEAKAEKAALKVQDREEKAALKEQDKAEKAALKEQDRAEKAALKEQEKAQKGQEKAEKSDQLEKEKAEKQTLKEAAKTQKDTVKAEKEAEKEKERLAKRQEKADKERAKVEKEEERERSRLRSKSPEEAKKGQEKAVVTSQTMIIKETMRGKESVIVVEKGPTTRSDSRSQLNIDVVTQSQFALLEAAVRQLKDVAVPKPLALPDNQKLRSDLVKGTASLPDTMQAMQVGARVKAAEVAIDRMTGILTQLSAAIALPVNLTEKIENVVVDTAVAVDDQDQFQAKPRVSVAPKKAVLIDPRFSQASRVDGQPSVASRLEIQPSVASSVAIPRPSLTTTPKASILSRPSFASMGPGVTHEEMNSALRDLGEEMSKNIQGMVSRATMAADNALHTVMNVANKLDVALKLDVRISSLFTLVSDYAEQLSGFDSGLTTQMQSFKDQIGQMRTDLHGGLAQLENVNNNAETAAVMELTERYTELVGELDTTLSAQHSLQQLHGKLNDELHTLVECVEMLREEKCDKDEVLDGLRDKADISRLAGLLSEAKFASARADFERRLDLCYEKFRRQDATWTAAIKDLTRLTDQKAELIELLSLRDHTQGQLQELHDRLRTLASALGEPKAALLTRLLSRDASCGVCGATALMEPEDADAGAPPCLPPLRAPPEPEPCTRWFTAEQPRERHACHRWVGGSHTLMKARGEVGRESAATAPIALDQHRVHKYTGYGDDGRLYKMEEELKPCIECNTLSLKEGPQPAAVPGGTGAGDAQD